uniref:Uncharacterized protein n=1 Tax=Trichogramma kaykai TaxID=54128 RepID=A0ABD2VSH2_9HYME
MSSVLRKKERVTRIERPYDRTRARGKINIACSAYNWSACAALIHRSKINTPGYSVYSRDRMCSRTYPFTTWALYRAARPGLSASSSPWRHLRLPCA